ncbi:MAG: hypothetical protein M5R36_15670 [Deltaproteobacteria bacterium]|nr:hypothetical protein [Deltaproteobacteria bacterium]
MSTWRPHIDERFFVDLVFFRPRFRVAEGDVEVDHRHAAPRAKPVKEQPDPTAEGVALLPRHRADETADQTDKKRLV